MEKAIVIGCPGSGKTTFARRLQAKTGLPLYHLDAVWHREDKTHISRVAFDRQLAEILQSPRWILDGNYQRTLARRLRQCDTVFLFDLPVALCLEGAERRLGTDRGDLPWQETVLSEEFCDAIRRFPRENLPEIYRLLEEHKAAKRIVIFRSRQEADVFLQTL